MTDGVANVCSSGIFEEDPADFRRSLVGFVRILSHKTVTSSVIFGQVAYPVRAEMFQFSKDYETCLIQSAHGLVAFRLIVIEECDEIRNAVLVGLQELVYAYPCSRYWMDNSQH